MDPSARSPSRRRKNGVRGSDLVLAAAVLLATLSRGAGAAAAFAGVLGALAPLPFARSDHTATAMPDRLVYIMGGCDGAQVCDNSTGGSGFCACTSFTRNVAAFDVASGTYVPANSARLPPPMPMPRYRHLACAVRDVIVIFGGRVLSTDAIITQVDAYNTTSRTWLPSAQLAPYPFDLGSDNSCSTVNDVRC